MPHILRIMQYIVLNVLLCFFSISHSYITQITYLQSPSGKKCFIFADDHNLGTIQDNADQANSFMEMLEICNERLQGSVKRLGVFFESQYFYKYFNRQDGRGIDIESFIPDEIKKKRNQSGQTTWISWDFPLLFLKNYGTKNQGDSMYIESVDPRLPLESFRAQSESIALPLKSVTFGELMVLPSIAINSLNNLISHTDVISSQAMNGLIHTLINPILKIVERLKTDAARAVKKGMKERGLKGDETPIIALVKELIDQEKEESSGENLELENILCDDTLFSEIVDLVILNKIVVQDSPDYSIVLVGSAHADIIIQQLKNFDFTQKELSKKPISKRNTSPKKQSLLRASLNPNIEEDVADISEISQIIDVQMRIIPAYIESKDKKNMSSSLVDLGETLKKIKLRQK